MEVRAEPLDALRLVLGARMSGITATISMQRFSEAWQSHAPIRMLCTMFTITRDQVTRLRVVWGLPPRNDRRLRYKPSGDEKYPEPPPDELRASEESLDLAPMIAARVTCVQASWDDKTWDERRASRPAPFSIAKIDVPDGLRVLIEFDDDCDLR